MSEFPIMDDHMHLQSNGQNVEAVKEFHRAGGTHLIVTHLPHKGYHISKPEDWRAQFDVTVQLAEQARKLTEVTIFVVLGPYPVQLVRMSEHMPLEKGVDIMIAGMDIAADYVNEGKAIALGEIGRPHFPVSKELIEASNGIMKYGMEKAKELRCAVVLHTEGGTHEVCRELAEIANSAGLHLDKVVKHFSGPIIRESENHGLFPSVLASRSNVEKAISQGNRFMLETDYLDDPRRPGAVLGIKTVPKRTKTFLETGLFSEEDVWAIHKDYPEKVYGISIE
ncbi:MAG: metal-dependent hydrolase [Nitrospira bacterium SG8_3]|nr:MAG: metal-dependent hydrolase [Nitrospira bacterium SG8_3]